MVYAFSFTGALVSCGFKHVFEVCYMAMFKTYWKYDNFVSISFSVLKLSKKNSKIYYFFLCAFNLPLTRFNFKTSF